MNNLIRIGKFDEDEIHMLPIMGMEEPGDIGTRPSSLLEKIRTEM